jgi:hypothetical protein
MKKFIVVEIETNKQTPFRHFADLINKTFTKSLGVESITELSQRMMIMTQPKFRTDLFLNSTGNELRIESFSSNYIKELDLEYLTDFVHDSKVVEAWIACGFVYNNSSNEFEKDLRFWYRSTEDFLLYDCFTHEPISPSSNVIVNTVFILHGSVIGAPVYHMLLNDDLIFDANSSINNEKFLVEPVSFHDGTFKEFLLKPGISKGFVQDNIIITPREEFVVDFYSRTALYNKGFPFEKLQLKVRSNLSYEKLATGQYKFSLEGKNCGYIYARINSRFGIEQEKSTTLRAAYTVHKS